jgi:hypothetical protein
MTPCQLGGYLGVQVEKAPETFNAGYSMYVAAWPIVETYPGNCFQTGLFGTWMFPTFDDPKPGRKLYSDIEGGLGWWRDTRFATETPKFIMGGVTLNFAAWANGPGAGKGRDWENPRGHYGVAQLSPWVLWPPDGLNVKQGTCGELWGYGYLPLPLINPKATTGGKPVPTGGNCWTLFLNTGNFKGPVAFFTPYFFSSVAEADPSLAGLFLDSRPSAPNRAIQMETQYIPAALATDSQGQRYARIDRTCFPCGPQGESTILHQVTVYTKDAFWKAVDTWLHDNGPAVLGPLIAEASLVQPIVGENRASWSIFEDGTPRDARILLDWKSFATAKSLERYTYGYRWNDDLVQHADSPHGPVVFLPEYYRLGTGADQKPCWVPVAAHTVPAETGLVEVDFTPTSPAPMEPYVTPDAPDSCWKKPGPVAGPFTAKLGDGSTVIYYWYRFADQPTLLNADLSDDEREALQLRVEKLHREWQKDGEYLPPPKTGTLADIDPALIVTPPAGFEAGYVPIVTWQGIVK